MSFPLLRRPGAIAFLDDDAAYLEMLALVLPTRWHIELFQRQHLFINQLQQEPSIWENDAWRQQDLVDQWRDGRPLIPIILDYWRDVGSRYALTQVCVVDYSMPGMNGLEVLGELSAWGGTRVLLTGQADEQIAVDAFNRGLIDQFIPKQSPGASQRVVRTIDDLLARPHPRLANLWQSTLTPAQNRLVSTPSIARDLRAYAAGRWVEYVLIGRPFGILGLQSDGSAEWLQLEEAASLPDLADLAESEGLAADCVTEIRAGTKLINLEMLQSLGLGGEPVLQSATRLGREPSLFAALFAIDNAFHLSQDISYGHWLARHSQRELRE